MSQCEHGRDWRYCGDCMSRHKREAQSANRVVAFVVLFIIAVCGLIGYWGAAGKLF